MTNSFTTLMKNVNNMIAWMTPYYFKFLYYFAVPTVIAAGKSINPLKTLLGLLMKPRSPMVDEALAFFFGGSEPARTQYGGYGPPSGMY
jgi:hypothetical protein